MGKTFIEILPLALAATVSPSGLLLVMAILSGKENPKRNALFFVLGCAALLVILGAFILLSYNPAISQTGQPGKVSAWIDVGLGLLILLIVAHTVFFKKEKKEEKKTRKHKRPFFVIGFLFMIVNTSSLIPFIVACKIIDESEPGFLAGLILFAILVAITMAMISLPVFITYAAPRQAEKILGPIKDFMARHGAVIAEVFFFVIAVYLIFRGVLKLS